MTRLGEKLKVLRGSTSLPELERSIGIARSLLSRYERGTRTPSPSTLKKIADYYKLPYKELRFIYYDDLLEEVEEAEIVQEWVARRFS